MIRLVIVILTVVITTSTLSACKDYAIATQQHKIGCCLNRDFDAETGVACYWHLNGLSCVTVR